MRFLSWISVPVKLLSFIVVLNLMACGGSSTPSPTTPPSATVNSISIAPYQINIANASSFQLIAVAYYSDGTSNIITDQVTWSLQNNIANITNTGLITATTLGSSTITATFENVSTVVQLAVSAATLTSINIDPGSNTIANGTSSVLQANGIYSDLSSQDLTAQVTWQTSNTAIATINTDGILSAQGVGNVIVTATLGAINKTTDITITAATLNSISVTPGNISIANGTIANFEATGFYSDSSSQDLTSQVSWQSNDTVIAEINSSGLLNSNNTGNTTVTASYSGQTSSASITVTAAALSSINITPGQTSIANGTSTSLLATGLYTDQTTQDLTQQVSWQSDNNAVSDINFNGLVSGNSVGTSVITASLGTISNTASVAITTATLSSINVTPGVTSIANGTNISLVANGIYSDQSTQDLTSQVTWQSGNSSITEVSSSGFVTARSVGTATITASLNGQSSSSSITVTTATLDSINISPNNSSLPNGANINLEATGFYSDSSSQDLTSQVSWQSSNSAIAEVNTEALVTSHNVGTATISASMGTVTSTASVTVTAASLTSINISPVKVNIALGIEHQFTVSGFYTDGSIQDLTQQVSFIFSNNAIAETVNNSAGSLLGTAIGTTSIAASLNGITGTASLTVTDAVINALEINSSNTSIALGTTLQLETVAIYSDTSNQAVTEQTLWQSSNPAVATVSSIGKVISQTEGSTTITSIYNGLSATLAINVTNAMLSTIEITPLTQSLPAGTTQAFSATGIYTDNSFQNITELVTWASSNTTVATISNTPNSKGQLTSSLSGMTDISASLSPITTTSFLTVTDAVLTSIDITPITSVISNGFTQIYTAIAHYSDGSINNVTDQVTWSTSDQSIANSNNSIIQSLQTGGVTVSANIGDVFGFANLSINSAVLQSISIDQLDVSIANGTQFEFTATGHYSDSSTQNLTNDVTWTSSSPQISTIQNSTESRGIARSVSEGLSIITATYSGISNSTNLTVTAATLVSIALQTSNSTLVAGIPQNIIATGTYSDSSTQDISNDVTWISSDTSVAAISNAITNKGESIGYIAGNSTITASLSGVTSPDLILTITSDPNAAISISANASPNVILNNGSDITTITATVRPAAISGVIASTPIDFVVTDNGISTTTTVNTINGIATLDITSSNEGFITVETQIQTSTLTSSTSLLSTTNFTNVLSRAVLIEPIYNGSYLIGSRFGLFMRNLSNREFTILEFQALNNGAHLNGSPTPGSAFSNEILSAGEFIWAIYVVDEDITNGGVITTRFILTDPTSGSTFGFEANISPPVQ